MPYALLHKEGNDAQLGLHWLNWADSDYVAARQLLRGGRLTQGAALANTAIEKYFKALFVLASIEIPRSHDTKTLHQQIIKRIPRLATLNGEFIEMLSKAYALRYPDDLSPGFNIAINDVSTLTELDRSVFEIRKGFDFKREDKKPLITTFDTWREQALEDLVRDNCYFGSANRPDLFKGRSIHYEFRVLDNGTFLEAAYFSENIQDDGKFLVEGLKPSQT